MKKGERKMTVHERDIKDIRTMKQVLFQKLQDENSGFCKSDITIKPMAGGGYIITIFEYEHAPFEMTFEYDDYFGYIVWVKDVFNNKTEIIDSKKCYQVEIALKYIGYMIANQF